MKQHERPAEIQDEGNLHHWRTELPNIIFELGLDPFALALYTHLKRSVGATDKGKCWKSTATLAKETCMSVGKVSEVKKKLTAKFPQLGGKSLIRVSEESRAEGQKPRHIVTILDVWGENFSYFAGQKRCSPNEHEALNDIHDMNIHVHHMNEPCSPHELKKEQIEERTNEEVVVEKTENEISPPPPQNQLSENLVVIALCNVCHLEPTALSDKDLQQMKIQLRFLKAQLPCQNSYTVAAEVRRRFACWDKPGPPFLSQISTNWVRMGHRAEQTQQLGANPDFAAERAAHLAKRRGGV